jgi:chemosensory pili system protein ChpA (sensor histidine kinase/response regulator)
MVAVMTQKTVMVVEDEPAIRGLLSMTLESENYEVETAGDGREALSKLEQRAPDVILLDLMLPNMDGWTLIDVLGDDSATDGIPIIVVSAGQPYLGVGEGGVQAFLSKPFDVDTLLKVLEEVLQ